MIGLFIEQASISKWPAIERASPAHWSQLQLNKSFSLALLHSNLPALPLLRSFLKMAFARLLRFCLALTAITSVNAVWNILQTNDDGWAVANIRAQNNALNAAGSFNVGHLI